MGKWVKAYRVSYNTLDRGVEISSFQRSSSFCDLRRQVSAQIDIQNFVLSYPPTLDTLCFFLQFIGLQITLDKTLGKFFEDPKILISKLS